MRIIQERKGFTMLELWDIYDENGNVTGRKMYRGKPAEGDYMLCVHMYIYNSKKKFLIQQRSFSKSSFPGAWDVTCGAVLAGETSLEAAKREIFEELGLSTENASIEMVGRLKREYSFADIYFIQMEFDLSACILQKEEVEAVKEVNIDEVIEMIENARNRDEDYIELIIKQVNKMKQQDNLISF